MFSVQELTLPAVWVNLLCDFFTVFIHSVLTSRLKFEDSVSLLARTSICSWKELPPLAFFIFHMQSSKMLGGKVSKIWHLKLLVFPYLSYSFIFCQPFRVLQSFSDQLKCSIIAEISVLVYSWLFEVNSSCSKTVVLIPFLSLFWQKDRFEFAPELQRSPHIRCCGRRELEAVVPLTWLGFCCLQTVSSVKV